MTTPPSTPKPIIWFPDTAFLVTAAVSQDLFYDIKTVVSDAKHRIGYLKVVADELVGFSSTWTDPATGSRDLPTMYSWLGDGFEITNPEILEAAGDIQLEIANGRPLRHDQEHWAESVIVATAERIKTVRPILLSDDYDARAAAKGHNKTAALSIHRLLSMMVKQGKIDVDRAHVHCEAIKNVNRGPDVTKDELLSSKLGRIGQP